MENQWIVHPTRDEVRDKARNGQALDSRDIFLVKSRSFVYPVEFLRKLKGPNEYDKRDIILLFYDWCREADEAEDGRFPIPVKRNVLSKIRFLVSEVAKRGSGESLDDLIQGADNLPFVTREMLYGVRAEDEDARLFIEHFGNGPVLRDTHGLRQDIKDIFSTYVGEMANGMSEFIERRELQNENELLTYIHYAAELFGVGLDNIIKAVDNTGLDIERGKAFARFLQLTNIARNIKEDADARSDYPDSRILFLPRDWYQNLSPNELMDNGNADAKRGRADVFTRLEALAKSSLQGSIQYMDDVPIGMTGYLGFLYGCVVPGIEIWKLMGEYGAEEVFKGNQEAINLDRKTRANIIKFGLGIIPSGRTVDWLRQYAVNPGNYSFNEGEYRKWSREYVYF